MALIVEDGSIVANANSYRTVEEIRDYAAARGITLSTVDSEVEVLAIKAMDYLEAFRAKYQGSKTDPDTQELQWPRQGVKIDCEEFPDDEIPKELQSAQSQLCIEVHNEITILPTTEQGFAVMEKLDVLEVQYSEKIGTLTLPTMTAVDALLDPLFYACGKKYSLVSVRI